MMRGTWLMALMVAAGCKGPQGLCLQSGCESAVPVTVVDDAGVAGALGPGSYRFVVTTDSAETEWSCELPGGDCGHDYFTDFEDGEDAGTLSLQARAGEQGLVIELLETRGNVWSGPERFTITIERDGEVVGEEAYAPKYRPPLVSDACAVCLTREGGELLLHLPG